MDNVFFPGKGGMDFFNGGGISPNRFDQKGTTAFFSTRYGPASRAEMLRCLESLRESPYLPVQKHTSTVLEVGPDTPPDEVADAVITRDPNRFIGVVSADCVPILVLDPVVGAVGAVHAGWRGTAAGILHGTIDRLTSDFGSRPRNLLVSVGPSIRSCCYNVGVEVADAVQASAVDSDESTKGEIVTHRGGRIFLDLARANRLQAIQRGVPMEHVEVVAACTFCQPERFHSFRRDGAAAGRQGAFIALNRCVSPPDVTENAEKGDGKR